MSNSPITGFSKQLTDRSFKALEAFACDPRLVLIDRCYTPLFELIEAASTEPIKSAIIAQVRLNRKARAEANAKLEAEDLVPALSSIGSLQADPSMAVSQ